MTQLESPGVEASAKRTLHGSLGVTAIVFMVVAAASPLTVVGGAAPLGILLGNRVGFPALYAISAVILLLFAVGRAARVDFDGDESAVQAVREAPKGF